MTPDSEKLKETPLLLNNSRSPNARTLNLVLKYFRIGGKVLELSLF